MNRLLFFSALLLALLVACKKSNQEQSTQPIVRGECDVGSVPEREKCSDKVAHCYEGRNSNSLVCRRIWSDLKHTVSPAELIEISGTLKRVDSEIFLMDSLGTGRSLLILQDSCARSTTQELCSLADGEVVTVVGAYYSQDNISDRSMAGNILVLDYFSGGRPNPPPVER